MIKRLLPCRVFSAKKIPTRSFHAYRAKLLQEQQEKRSRSDNMSDNERDHMDRFIQRMQEFQEVMGQRVPMNFGTTFDNFDLANMFPFPNFQFKLFKQMYDPQFDEKEFLDGAKNAFSVVRPLLISKDLETLRHMCTPECFEAIEAFFEQMQQANQFVNVSLHGHIEELKSATIRNVRIREIDGRLDTVINVQVRPPTYCC